MPPGIINSFTHKNICLKLHKFDAERLVQDIACLRNTIKVKDQLFIQSWKHLAQN